MLDLAVAYREETFERMRDPLEERGIRARHVPTEGRAIALADPPWDAEGFDAGFVYPSRAMEGGVLDAALGVPWVNDREDVLTSRNKAGVVARLERAGIPVPETVLVSNPADESDLLAAFDRFDTPVVVKPNSTTRGVGVAKVGDADSFLGVTDYLDLVHDYRATGDKSFLVQEYVADATDYRAMVVDGECVGGVERRLPDAERESGRWKHNVHRGAEATGVDLPADLRDLAERTAGALGIDFLGVDILVSGDRAVVNETNARPTIDAETKYDAGFYDRLAGLIRETAGE
ncbi:RimK family alpha-L-glutamate ligase [Halorussus salilacus]|uniref:ATP-grasp domain-containing protein n=1 Tax=Halorussus salilacus TaxID=2953750 RepID=UPI00209C784D|nr:RimK family alpha-L-glutamate ligase [Halorussus salilacus]USZ69395.1 RimK family alpha-L-glutamate ligase [Halorussus salilacus]